MKRAALVVVAASLGLLLWFFLGRGAHSKKPAPSADPGLTAKVTAKVPESRRQDPVISSDDDPRGNLRLEGQVIDSNDLPVGGALVAINSLPPKTATSEADGSFHFDGLMGRPYTLVARARAGVAGPVTARPTSGEPIILRLAAGANVRVVVTSAASRAPVSAATVELRGVSVEQAVTDAAGKAALANIAPGSYQLVARAQGYAPRHSWIDVPAGGETTNVQVALSAGAAIAGRVLGPDSRPVEGATVLYQGVSDWAQQANAQLDGVLTKADGSWRIEALPAGTFRFEARAATFAPGHSEPIMLDGVTEHTGVDLRLGAGGVVRGRIEDTAHKLVAGARVRVGVASRAAGAVWRVPRQITSDDAGHFEVAGLPLQPLEIVALDASGASDVVEVDLSKPPAARDVVLTMNITAFIAGTVVDDAGQPVDGALVVADPEGVQDDNDRQLRGQAETGTDGAGRFAIRGLRPGAYVLKAQKTGAVARSRSSLGKGTRAQTGQDNVRLVVEAGGGIRGKVAFETGGSPPSFSVVLSSESATPFSADDGQFQLVEVPSGTYTVTIRGVGFASRDVPGVEVKKGVIVDLGTITLYKGRTVSGKVVQNGAPVANALVVAGRALFGSGTATQVSVGTGRADNAKETTTNQYGEFTVNGVSTGDLNLVAEHPDYGRSRTTAIQFNREPIEGIELVLLPFGAIAGQVLRGSEPAAGVFVNAQSTTAPGALYGVATGPDGKFRFDRLAPDTYKVSAVAGDPSSGMNFHSAAATVAPGETATVNLVLDLGTVTLNVLPKASNAASVGFAIMFATTKPVAPKTMRELQAVFATLGDAFTGFSLALNGQPAVIKDLKPGSYSICSWVFPNETKTKLEIQAYGDREGDNLKVFCMSTMVAPAPAEQSLELAVEVPAYIPPPKDKP